MCSPDRAGSSAVRRCEPRNCRQTGSNKNLDFLPFDKPPTVATQPVLVAMLSAGLTGVIGAMPGLGGRVSDTKFYLVPSMSFSYSEAK
jgi:hypothetical protein